MNSWDEGSRDGMEDQKERKEKVGKKVEPVTRPGGMTGQKGSTFVDLTVRSSRPSPRWGLLSLSERTRYH